MRRVRTGLATVLGTLALLLLADTGAWWTLTGRLLAQAARWRQEIAAAGYGAEAGPPRRAGWPLRAELVVPDVTLAAGAGQPDAPAWHAGAVRVSAVPWRPGEVTLLPEGAEWLRAGELTATLAAGRLAITLAHGDATVSGHGVRLTLAAGEAGADTVLLRLHGEEASLALAGLNTRAGASAARLDLHARWSRPVPPLGDPAALAAWRDAGGRLTLDGVSLRWGAADAEGEATLGLDDALHLEAAGHVRLSGFAEASRALAQAGLITPGAARAASTLLGLVAVRGADGIARAALPFAVRDGVLSAGAIPLLRVP